MITICWCCQGRCTGVFRYEHPDLGDVPCCLACAAISAETPGCTAAECLCRIVEGATERLATETTP